MMTEISLNILDVTENSTRAGAKVVHITVDADEEKDLLRVIIEDDGCGMSKEQLASVKEFRSFVKLRYRPEEVSTLRAKKE